MLSLVISSLLTNILLMDCAKYPCGICNKNVTDNAIECCICFAWIHIRCAELNKNQLKRYGNLQWFCSKCKECFPYHGIDNDEFIHAILSPNCSQNGSCVRNLVT